MRISDWSSDVCSSDLLVPLRLSGTAIIQVQSPQTQRVGDHRDRTQAHRCRGDHGVQQQSECGEQDAGRYRNTDRVIAEGEDQVLTDVAHRRTGQADGLRSEEHTSELQSLMRNSYAVFCLKKKKQK